LSAKVLRVQIETRLEDWRAGGLDGFFFGRRAKEMAEFVSEAAGEAVAEAVAAVGGPAAADGSLKAAAESVAEKVGGPFGEDAADTTVDGSTEAEATTASAGPVETIEVAVLPAAAEPAKAFEELPISLSVSPLGLSANSCELEQV
jgi:hypothetical protein